MTDARITKAIKSLKATGIGLALTFAAQLALLLAWLIAGLSFIVTARLVYEVWRQVLLPFASWVFTGVP